MADNADKRIRRFEVVTQAAYLPEPALMAALQGHGMVTRWAYILHDRDPVRPGDAFAGLKPPHWHVVAEMSGPVPLKSVASWFGVPPNFVRLPKGRGDRDFFWSKCEYLTHEHPAQVDQGKFRYPDSCVRASFPFREELSWWQFERDSRGAEGKKKKKDLRGMVRSEVLYNGMTIKEVCRRWPDAYRDDFTALDKLRKKYIADWAPMPPWRLNFYIDGKGGIGKNTASRAIARAAFPETEDPDELFFEVGGGNVTFEGYDGQPVLIWNDRRAVDFITEFGRGEVFDMFESHPTRSLHDVKYGSVKLINSVNIVNGVEPFLSFLKGISGEYVSPKYGRQKAEDKGQAFRRFPVIVSLREDEFDVFVSKGVVEGTFEYDQYIGWSHIMGSFARLAQRLDAAQAAAYERALTWPITEAARMVAAREGDKITDPAQAAAEFGHYGRIMPPEEVEAKRARTAAWREARAAEHADAYREYRAPFLDPRDYAHRMEDMMGFEEFLTSRGVPLDPPPGFAYDPQTGAPSEPPAGSSAEGPNGADDAALRRAFADYVFRQTTEGLEVRDGGREYSALATAGAGWELIREWEWRRNDWFDRHSPDEVEALFHEWAVAGGILAPGRLEHADPLGRRIRAEEERRAK